ncbi:hypothetical protein [Nitrospirillum iridis]|uniref:Uncharacterized protein n=1 Tax=Nitrospirillum iridis TaxID=765888 RepID=A0A7X0B529_9PROT|nr:hypothetical protein [Nitrospirillum iridis]MBB6254800.1 hypothetical protein [Nitrospirillum iridis]
MVRNDVLTGMQDDGGSRPLIGRPLIGRPWIERIEDALVSVNPDLWLVAAVLVVAIRCLGGLA